MTARLLSYVFVALIAFAGGFMVGNWNTDGSAGSDENAGAAAKMDDGGQVDGDSAIPIGDSAVLGKDSAIITVVEFSDFQCPFCQRGANTMKELVEKYPNDVRVVFKHYPLPFHKEAPAASKAAIAAGKQGKFWEMHDWLFENQKQLKQHSGDMKEWTAGHAKELGLDVAKFKKDFDAPETQKQIDEDMKLGQEVAVRGTPHFFVNGERVKGAKPISAFEEIVKRQIKEAKGMLGQAGVTRANLYEKMVAKNFDGGKEKPQQKPNKPAQKVEFVPVEEGDPMFGNAKDPLVTIVEFSDFQCPFCGKVLPTLDKIKEEYGDQVRVVFKQLPLGMHAQAKPAAQAALAAHKQGKFWEMHDKLFEKQREMRANANNFEEWAAGLAKELGLNVAKFKKDYNDPAIAAKVERDLKLSQKVGARGTPNFWINGVNLRGAQPFPSFKAEIDKQIKLAKELKKKGLSGEKLYKAAVAENKKNAPKAAPQPKRDQPAPKVDVKDLATGDAYTKGPDNAPVKIVEFTDFQCPYCNRGGKNMKEAAKEFGDKVQIIVKNYPLPFHKEAPAAAKAAMAAGEQGKYWEMYDLLFQNQRRLKEDGIFKELAKQLGLNMAKFNKDMQNPEYDKIIKQDMAQGQKVGVRGTPAFFINGRRVVGAQPPSKFKSEIEAALKEAK
ncbi:thioredoxin [Persicimonas caeni]|uniref:Thioredoxin n=1 Tax=Persicimonas caeni TaxID=2292766 RepID=A0A4Y6PTR7_PERCE|nr:thioredoxin domain-containing protein [Persicimonas caeni]QDG51724.1 thioredoxin [Persicimonas caeni]QED32945.1 thioredoxin [Persicimonas caeni]